MITELLEPTKIVVGIKGDFAQVLETLCKQSAIPGLSGQFRNKTIQHSDERFSYIGDGIAVPHLRVDNLPAPELILGVSREGIKFNTHVIKIVLFLVTPIEQPAQHLQLLQRVCSLLPAIREGEALAQRDPAEVLKVIARAERQSALPTYINLTQEQIAFELQSDVWHQWPNKRRGSRASGAVRTQPLKTNLPDSLVCQTHQEPLQLFCRAALDRSLALFHPGSRSSAARFGDSDGHPRQRPFCFLQEYKSDRALEMLQQLIAQRCRVIRDGKLSEIEARDIVPGDVIVLRRRFRAGGRSFVGGVRSRSGQLVSHRRIHAGTSLQIRPTCLDLR